MRVNCVSCGHKARIAKTEDESASHVKLFCVCLDIECSHSFVAELNFSHTLKPSKLVALDGVVNTQGLQESSQQMQLIC